MWPAGRAVSGGERISDRQRHIRLCYQLRHYVVPAVFPAQRRPYLVRQILDSLPLTDFAKQHLFAKFVGVSRATVKGTAVVAVVQGRLAALRLQLWVSMAAYCGAR
jgi:hypothetical protein